MKDKFKVKDLVVVYDSIYCVIVGTKVQPQTNTTVYVLRRAVLSWTTPDGSVKKIKPRKTASVRKEAADYKIPECYANDNISIDLMEEFEIQEHMAKRCMRYPNREDKAKIVLEKL